MAAYAALVSLLNNIHAIMNHPTLSSSLDDEQIQPLLEKTNFLLDFIEGNNYGGRSKEAHDLERKITSTAHAAEDLIESKIVDQIHAVEGPVEPHIVNKIHEGYRRPYLPTCLLACVGKPKKPRHLQHINEEMDIIVKEANEFKETLRLEEEEEEPQTHPAGPITATRKTAMVGLDAELNQLLNELTGYQSSRRIISIVGMGGTGKTILAQNVYQNLLIKEKFHVRAWATISQQINAQEVLKKLLSLSVLGDLSEETVDELGVELCETLINAQEDLKKLLSRSVLGDLSKETVDELGVELYKTLFGRRYLIVLDDIWSVEAWDKVKHFFPDNKNGSRILLTTRLSNVAKDCGSSLFMVNLLDEENSWKLFCEKAFQGKDCPLELQKVGEEIVASCKGLALSIVVIGGLLLKSPRAVKYWETVAKHLKSIPNSKEKQESLDVLSLSYYNLPPHLKPCFLYMGVFKEDSDIRVTKLIKIWVAEGFIKPIESQVLEDIAWGYINDLIDRNLILVRRHRKNGDVGSCGIHDILRHLCIKLVEQEDFFHLSKGLMRGTERRLVGDFNIGRTKKKHPLTRSIMTSGFVKSPVEYKLLRVLGEEVSDSEEKEFYPNVNLRYLDGVCFQPVPTSVSLLWNLQTLIIKNRPKRDLVNVPNEIWKMRQLRHVDYLGMYIPGPPRSNGKDELLMLENLQTLKGIVNLRLCEEVCRIIPNIKKLHLVYDPKLHGYDDSLIECLCNLDCLHKLVSLRLSIFSNTFLNREFEKKLISFPMSLKKLYLRWYNLEWDDMSMIGLLPQLEVLELEDIASYGGGQWSPTGAISSPEILENEILLSDSLECRQLSFSSSGAASSSLHDELRRDPIGHR